MRLAPRSVPSAPCRSLRLIQRAYWDAAVKGLASPVTSPAAMSFDTLPLHWRFLDRLYTCRLGPNRIDGGDFEDWDTMKRAGWRHILHPAADGANGGRSRAAGRA